MWKTGFISVVRPLNVRNKPNLDAKIIDSISEKNVMRIYQWKLHQDVWYEILIYEPNKKTKHGFIRGTFAKFHELPLIDVSGSMNFHDLPFENQEIIHVTEEDKKRFIGILTWMIGIIENMPVEDYATNMKFGDVVKYLVKIMELKRKISDDTRGDDGQ